MEVVKRNELHTFVVLPKMGGGAVFRLAGEVPPPLEELRKSSIRLQMVVLAFAVLTHRQPRCSFPLM